MTHKLNRFVLLMLASPSLVFAALPGNAEVEALLNKHLIANDKAKGVAVALVDASGVRVVTAGSARTGEPVNAQHLFEIGSVTKTFTGLLLAIADEKNEAKLDDPVEKFLPDGIKLRDRDGLPIRMVDLATHRSGLPRLATNMLPNDPKDPYAGYSEPELLDFIKHFSATRARNVQYEYSNIGFGLLGYVLVRAAKSSDFEALLNSRVLQPMGMLDTTTDPKRLTGRVVQPHDTNGRATPTWTWSSAHAGTGAIRSTAADMGRYVQSIAGRPEAPNPSTLTGAIGLATTMREQGPGRINPIGLAWIRLPFDAREFMNHDGGTFGSSASLMVDRAAKEGVFVVTNSATPLNDIALHLMDSRHNLGERALPKIVPVSGATLAQYVGVYRLNDQMQITIRAKGDTITAQATNQGEFELFAQSETRFFAKVAAITLTFGGVVDGLASSFVIEQAGSKTTAKRLP